MKTIVTILLSLVLMPVLSPAQLTISTNEFYHIGDEIQMVNCLVPANDSVGAGITWDFSADGATGGVSTTYVLHDTSTVFSANLMLILPDGSIEYMQENNTDSYVQGIENASSHVVTNYNNYDIARRPVTYGSHLVDTYRVNIPAVGTHGTGVITQDVDGYGTLISPTGTFSNVLRVKKSQMELDTTTAGVTLATTFSYLWFDTMHTAPLFRIDSVSNALGSIQSAGFLAAASGVAQVHANSGGYTAYMQNSELDIAGPFVSGSVYRVVVYNLIGSKVAANEIVAEGTRQSIDMQNALPPGVYVVSISEKNNPAGREVIKVMKQN